MCVCVCCVACVWSLGVHVDKVRMNGEVTEVSGVRLCEIRMGGTFTFTIGVVWVLVWGLGFGGWDLLLWNWFDDTLT